MNARQWSHLPVRLGLLAIAVGGLTIIALWYGAGEQQFATTQLPYVLVAGGAGVGLIGLGTSIIKAQRERFESRAVANSAARVLLAAAQLRAIRQGDRHSSSARRATPRPDREKAVVTGSEE